MRTDEGSVATEAEEPAGAARGLRLALAGGPATPLVAGVEREPPPMAAARSRRDRHRRLALAGADVAGLSLAYLTVWLLHPPGGALTDRLPLLLAVPMWLLVHKLLGLYDRDDKVIHRSSLDELPAILHALTLGTILVFFLSPVLLPVELERGPTAAFVLLAAGLIPAARTLARHVIRRLHEPERCVIVGWGGAARSMHHKIAAHPEYGVTVAGYVGAEDPLAPAGGARRLGAVDQLDEVCRRHRIERVVVVGAVLSPARTLEVVRTARRAGLKVTVVPDLSEAVGRAAQFDEVEGITVLSLGGRTRSRTSLALKRMLDVTGAAAGLIVLSPLLAAIAIAIKLESPGPVLFRQPRIGRDRTFSMLKFRSMVDGADDMKQALLHLNEMRAPMFKIAADPRVTRVGRWLRRTSLDELPQLWNVLRGEMSLVGPRPLVPDEDDHVVGWHRDRLDLTPGLTGPWQVHGRNAVPFQEMVKMDYLYVAEWSLWTDIRLLLQTAPVVLFGRGS